jgi:hypothetical protein
MAGIKKTPPDDHQSGGAFYLKIAVFIQALMWKRE